MVFLWCDATLNNSITEILKKKISAQNNIEGIQIASHLCKSTQTIEKRKWISVHIAFTMYSVNGDVSNLNY